MKNNIFILAEGEHDAAFIFRIIIANGIKSYNEPIKKYPKLLCDLFIKDYSSIPVEEIKIGKKDCRLLPYYAASDDNNYICIYSANGVANEKTRKDFIRKLNNFLVSDPLELEAAEDNIYSLLFFIDADNDGVNERIKKIKEEIKIFFNIDNFDKNNNYEICTTDNLRLGIFVFTGKDNNTGLLEDILIPIMESGNEYVFKNAREYLLKNKSIIDKNIEKKNKDFEYYEKKSIIGIAGQLQISGVSNAVYIRKTDYLTDEKIRDNNVCNEIFSFIKSVMV